VRDKLKMAGLRGQAPLGATCSSRGDADHHRCHRALYLFVIADYD